MIFFLKKIKRFLIFTFIYLNAVIKKNFFNNNKIVFLLGVPWHGNMGDQAIVYSERVFLKYNTDLIVIEIPSQYLIWYFDYFKTIIGDNDIFVHGGGFIGSLWPDEDIMIRKVLECFKTNRIVVLPQTIYFDDNEKNLIGIYKELISNCTKLKICAREKYSYEFAVKNELKNVYLVPDMVTYIKKNDLDFNDIPNKKENDIVFCFRNDKEKTVTNDFIIKLEKYYTNKRIRKIDTFENKTVYPIFRKRELRKKLLQFSNAEIVFTDRLHGMVFAAIMGTPCVVLSNCNYKIKGVYEWIKNNDYVQYVDNEDDVFDVIKSIPAYSENVYHNENAVNSFSTLIEILGE